MKINFEDDGKGKHQSITATLKETLSFPDALVALDVYAYGRDRTEATFNLEVALRELLHRLEPICELR